MTYDCRTCGACCKSDTSDDHYIEVTPEDEARLTKRVRRNLIVLPGSKALPTKRVGRATDYACVMHIGRFGHESQCAIYERRPSVCVEFEPGSRACRIARQDIGLPP